MLTVFEPETKKLKTNSSIEIKPVEIDFKKKIQTFYVLVKVSEITLVHRCKKCIFIIVVFLIYIVTTV